MTTLPPLNQAILVNATQAIAAMEQVVAGLQVVGTEASATATKVKTSTASMGASMLKSFAGLAVVGALTHELIAMKNEAINLDVAGTRLEAALSGVGITAEKTQEQVFAAADAYGQLGFQGSEAVSAMGTLVTATNSVDQATRLMAMSADLARYKHIDMESAAKILARGTQGSAKAFKELGITLDATLPKNQAISAAFDELNTKIGGQAVAYTQTFAGQTAILSEKFDGLVQTIAAAVMPILTKLVAGLGFLVTYLQENAVALGIYGVALLLVVGYFKLLALWEAIVAGLDPFHWIILGAIALGVLFAYLWNRFETFRKVVVTGIKFLLTYWGYLIGYVSTFLKMISHIPGMGFLKGVAEWGDKVALSLGKAAKSVDKLKDAKLTMPKVPKIGDFVNPNGSAGIKGQAPGGDATKGGGSSSGTVQYVTVYASNTNDIANKLSKAAKHGQPIGGTR